MNRSATVLYTQNKILGINIQHSTEICPSIRLGLLLHIPLVFVVVVVIADVVGFKIKTTTNNKVFETK